MEPRIWAANNLAAKLLAGPWEADAVKEAVNTVLGPIHHRTRQALIVRLMKLGQRQRRPSPATLQAFLVGSAYFKPAHDRQVDVVLDAPMFAPVGALSDCAMPALSTLKELAEWLKVSPEQLDWMSDERRNHRHAARRPLQHYHYAFINKREGKVRLVEAPKARLKALQRQILREILYAVRAHACAHGFVPKRSCLTGAQIHAGEEMVLTLDLAQFFPSIRVARIFGIFRTLGYPWTVSRRLAGLCTTMTPRGVFDRLPVAQRPSRDDQALYSNGHLPQGAPTSPALANLACWRLDRRLLGLARSVDANYTRYADDLAFSGGEGFAAHIESFQAVVERVIREEGFTLNPHKIRFMPRHTRQRVTGIVVNEHCNIGRAEFETLKAILYNCARSSPTTQNAGNISDYRGHLDGRLSWVEQVNQRRGAKLRRLFDKIDWTPPSTVG